MDKIDYLESELENLKKLNFEKEDHSKGQLGLNAQTSTGGAIGNNSFSTDGFAGGNNAKASANGSVQLGTGNNESENTLQFQNYQILNASGKIPNNRLDLDTTLSLSSSKPVTSAGILAAVQSEIQAAISNILIAPSQTNATPNTTYVDTNAGGELYYTRLGNVVFAHINNITFKNVRQEHDVTIFSNLPKAASVCFFCMTCWAGSIYTMRYKIDTNQKEVKNYWSAYTPTTSQKWSGTFIYLTNE